MALIKSKLSALLNERGASKLGIIFCAALLGCVGYAGYQILPYYYYYYFFNI